MTDETLPNPAQLRAMARPQPAPQPCMPGRHCERRERNLGACVAGHCNPPPLTERTNMEHGNAPAAGQQSEREAFEAWYVQHGRENGMKYDAESLVARREGNTYGERDYLNALWSAWQARATLPAAAACAEQGEPAVLPEGMSRDEMLKYYSDYANMVCREVVGYQKQIRELKAALAAPAPSAPADQPSPDKHHGSCGVYRASGGPCPCTCAAASPAPTEEPRTDGGEVRRG